MIVLIAACVMVVLVFTTVMFEIKDRRRKRRRFVPVDPPGPRTIIVTQNDRPNPRAPWPRRD